MANKKKDENLLDETSASNNGEPEVIPVVSTGSEIPTVEVNKTEVAPVVVPTAITPNVVYEENGIAPGTIADAPQLLLNRGERAKRVRVICEGVLGDKILPKGSITDDPEYVALLKTDRGRTLVEEVK